MTKPKLTDNSNITEKPHERRGLHLNAHGNTRFAKKFAKFYQKVMKYQ